MRRSRGARLSAIGTAAGENARAAVESLFNELNDAHVAVIEETRNTMLDQQEAILSGMQAISAQHAEVLKNQSAMMQAIEALQLDVAHGREKQDEILARLPMLARQVNDDAT